MHTISYASKRVLFALGFFCLFAAAALAQKINVTVYVTDAGDKSPLENVSVTCEVQKTGGYTDEDGLLKLELDRAESIFLKFSLVGYTKETKEVKITAGKASYEVRMALTSEDIIGETAVITASGGTTDMDLAGLTVSMDLVKPKQIDAQASTDIQDVLEQSPGVDIKDDQLNIRGSSGFAYGVGSRVMIMMNSLPLLSADASFAQFDLIPMDNIKQIEIMKGASSVLYGSSALGGVVNVITADAPSIPLTSLRIRGGFFDKPANPLLDWDGPSSAYVASMNVFHTRQIKNNDFSILMDLNKDSGYRQGADKEQLRAMIMTKFRPKNIEGLNWGFNASTRHDSSGAILYWSSYEPDTAIRQIYYNGAPYITDTVLTGGALTPARGTLRKQLNSRYVIDPFLKFLVNEKSVINYRGRMMKTVNRNETNQSNNNMVLFNDVQFKTTIFDSIAWVSGATFQYNTIRGDSLYDGKHTAMNMAGYTQMDAKFGRLSVSAGARYDFWDMDGKEKKGKPIFRAGVNYEIGRGTHARANFGQAFRAPSAAERYTSTVAGGLYISPNPTLDFETGYSGEIGLRQDFLFGKDQKKVYGYVDAAGFIMDYNNMVEFGMDTVLISPSFEFQPFFQAVNIADTRITGFEITGLAAARLNKFTFNLSGGVTVLNPVNKNPTPDSLQLDLTVKDPLLLWFEFNDWATGKKQDNPEFLKYRERLTVRASVTLGYDRFWFMVMGRKKSRMETYDQFLNFAVVDIADFYEKHPNGYTVLDCVVGYDLSDQTTLSLNVDNITNTEYAMIPGTLGKQRNFILQIKHLF